MNEKPTKIGIRMRHIVSHCPEYVLRKIHYWTFLGKNSGQPFYILFYLTLTISLATNNAIHAPEIYKWPFFRRFTSYMILFIPVNIHGLYFFSIHHCKNSLSSVHIFVHHCTFCASLHVKTCSAFMHHLFAQRRQSWGWGWLDPPDLRLGSWGCRRSWTGCKRLLYLIMYTLS